MLINVTTTNTDKLSAVLTVEIKPEDYEEKVDKVLQDYRRKANIPGFRPGHVPKSLIKKQYGKAILVDEVNHILQHAVYDHIREKNLDILGNPLPVENDSIDWDSQKEFSFEFELGLAPDFELKLSNRIKVPYYKIVADKEMVDRYVTDYAKRFGTMSYPDTTSETSIVKAQFVQLDGKGNKVENGIEEEASLSLESVVDKKSKKGVTGLKIGDKITLNLKKALKEDFNLASLLNTEKGAIESAQGEFELEIKEISQLDPAPLNQELFDKVFGPGVASSEEEFRNKVKEDAEKMFVNESERKFYDDVKTTLLGKIKFDLPDEFLKKWMQSAGEKPISKEEVEEQYPDMKDSMRWQLIENRVIKENDIQVGQEELVAYTKQMVMRQMAQYGQMPTGDDLDSIAKRVLENKEEAQRVTDQLYSDKLKDFFKENLKVDEKEVNFDEFLKKVK